MTSWGGGLLLGGFHAAFVRAARAQEVSVNVGESEIVYYRQELREIGLNDWPDGTFGVLKEGEEYTFYAANSATPYVTKGTLDKPAQNMVASVTITGGEPYDYKAGGPVYRDPASGKLLLFYEGEIHIGGDSKHFYSVIGLAVSTDETGRNFRDLGAIIQPNLPLEQAEREGKIIEVGGGPYVVRDGYFYVYFSDSLASGGRNNLAVARAPVAEVVEAALANESVPWLKYYEGSFSEPGIGGLSSPLEPGNPPTSWMDLSYNTYLDKIVMVVADFGGLIYPNLYITWSDDGLNWAPRILLADELGESFYPSLIGLGDDPKQTDQSFYVYYTLSLAGGWSRWTNALLERRLISFA